MNIYLIGYRGTGKTSIGKALARRLGWAFVDTDARVIDQLGTAIADYVRRQGWDAFRDAERRMVAGLTAQSRRVLATGGGVVLIDETVRRMKRSGVVVWLQASESTIKSRIAADTQTAANRPSLTGKGVEAEIAAVLAERTPLYRAAADVSIDTDGIGIGEAVEKILEILPQYGIQSEHNSK
jgi:shikimate kinase